MSPLEGVAPRVGLAAAAVMDGRPHAAHKQVDEQR
jgi:hypothetical protein